MSTVYQKGREVFRSVVTAAGGSWSRTEFETVVLPLTA